MGVDAAFSAHCSPRGNLSDVFKSNRRRTRRNHRRLDGFYAAGGRLFLALARSAEHVEYWRPRFTPLAHGGLSEYLLRLGIHRWRRPESFARAYHRGFVAFERVWR